MKKRSWVSLGFLNCGMIILTAASFFVLSSSKVRADAYDYISITVPTNCSLLHTEESAHEATISGGLYLSNIGESTIKAICNDNEGFVIYAVGYTDDTDGNNVLTDYNLGSSYDIQTGLLTSGNASQWAMKLSAISSPTPTYPITILSDTEGSFASFHTVPDELVAVAKRTAATDTGNGAEGSSFKTTYQTYISPTQSAGTYVGQVKYVLVHPNYVTKADLDNAVTVAFNGNGLLFPGGSSTNVVKYTKSCRPGEYAYVGNSYQEVMTSNILTGGAQNGAYTNSEGVLQTLTLPNADMVRVEVQYGNTADTIEMQVTEGTWDGNWNNMPDRFYDFYNDHDNITGTKTMYFEGDTVTVLINSWDIPESGYDFGFYVKVYPIYYTEQANTTYEELPPTDCAIFPVSGSYKETTTWKGKWLTDSLNDNELSNEYDLKNYLLSDFDYLQGTTITVTAYNPYEIVYNGNGASSEFGMGVHHYYEDRGDFGGGWSTEMSSGREVTLLAPNYKKNGYGFIGWSTDASAANHISQAQIYGPNEHITIDNGMISGADSNHNIKLYAIWLASAGNLQGWSGCSSMSVGDLTALTDTRDNDTYAIAKLGDGKCWMIENLRLGGSNAVTLTTTDSQSAGILPAATNSNWPWTNDALMSNINTGFQASVVENIHQRNYAYGNYYSWYAAINRTELAANNNESNLTSICPSNWRIPTSSEYNAIINYGQNNQEDIRAFPRNFVFNGFFNHTSNDDFDNYLRSEGRIQLGKGEGYYWTSSGYGSSATLGSSATSFSIYDSSSLVYGANASGYGWQFYGTDGSVSNGYGVRCMTD